MSLTAAAAIVLPLKSLAVRSGESFKTSRPLCASGVTRPDGATTVSGTPRACPSTTARTLVIPMSTAPPTIAAATAAPLAALLTSNFTPARSNSPARTPYAYGVMSSLGIVASRIVAGAGCAHAGRAAAAAAAMVASIVRRECGIVVPLSGRDRRCPSLHLG